MSAKFISHIIANYVLLARGLFLTLGCIAFLWGAVGFHLFLQEISIERIANRIIAGDPFKMTILIQQLPAMGRIENSAYCRPAALRSATIIQIRMAEITTAAKTRNHPESQLASLDRLIRSSLSCSPADPFLWLALFWLDLKENDFRPKDLKYLQISYQLGPNEGWIGIKRNRLAFSKYDHLPQNLAERTISEFIELVKSGFAEQAAEIFIDTAWPKHQVISARLKSIPDRYQEQFSRALKRFGYDGDRGIMMRSKLRP